VNELFYFSLDKLIVANNIIASNYRMISE